MVAVLPSSTAKLVQATPQPAQKPNVLMVVGIKDKVSALNFANKLKAEKGVTSKELDYKGQKVTETINTDTKNYSAVLNTHLVFAPEQKALEQTIDTFQGEPSFASIEGADSFFSNSVDVKKPSLANAILDSIRGIGISASSPNKSTSQVEMLLALKPKTIK